MGWRKLETISEGELGKEVGTWMASGSSTTLPIVNAVTAYEDANRTVLLGLGGAAYNSDPKQIESLVNSHIMRDFNVIVDDIKKEHGGKQQIVVDDIELPLEVSGERNEILFIQIRQPTNKELQDLPIHWLTPRMPRSANQYLLSSTRMVKAKQIQTVDNWEERLGNAPEFAVAKTLEATTQYSIGPVEMDTRGEPRQHRKQRLVPLHPTRLNGRTDSDTFYSSIKSIRGYTCIQLFVHLPSQNIYIVPMRRESQSHGAYQDFIRYVGAPNVLLTDNAKTLIGKKWLKISRAHVIKQIASVPHNQHM